MLMLQVSDMAAELSRVFVRKAGESLEKLHKTKAHEHKQASEQREVGPV